MAEINRPTATAEGFTEVRNARSDDDDEIADEEESSSDLKTLNSEEREIKETDGTYFLSQRK